MLNLHHPDLTRSTTKQSPPLDLTLAASALPQGSRGTPETLPAVQRSDVSAARLSGALLAYMLGVTLIITLLPFQFSWPSEWRVMTTGGPIDIVANVLLFMPLGALFRIATRLSKRHSVIGALAAGLLASMAIEALQLFEPERYTSVLDVAANGVGAWFGSLAYDTLSKRRAVDARLIGLVFLELPLMGLLYLTVPLLWLTALVATASPNWAWSAIPVAAYAGMLLGGTIRHISAGTGVSPRRAASLAAGGIVVGMFPALARAPVAVAASALTAFAVTRLAATHRSRSPMWNRRFEVPVLRSAAPFYAVFLAAIVLLPLQEGVARWSLGFGFPGVADTWDKIEILRFLVRLAAFSLLGYMIAEYRGREELGLRDAVPRMLRWSLTAATAAEVLLGYRAGRGASIAQWGVVVFASLYGGWLYRLQRDHVVTLVSESTPPSEPVPTDL